MIRVLYKKTLNQTTSQKNLSKNTIDLISKEFVELSQSTFGIAKIKF